MNDIVEFPSPVSLESSEFGLRAVVHQEWNEKVANIIKQNSVLEIELNDGKGWRGDNIDFLVQFPDLRSLTIRKLNLKSVAAINSLTKLESLSLSTYCQTPILFDRMGGLRHCEIEWRTGSETLFDCLSLRTLTIIGLKLKASNCFSKLQSLECLSILSSSIIELSGLRTLKKLKRLRLANNRQLVSLCGIESLDMLEDLDVNTCKKLTNIEPVKYLKRLQRLQLNNLGTIDSLAPVQSLSSLEMITFYESTDVLDGQLTPLLDKPSLKTVSFKNRRHYTHCTDDFSR